MLTNIRVFNIVCIPIRARSNKQTLRKNAQKIYELSLRIV